MKRIVEVQRILNAPKDKFNSFGGYNYRSCEGILEAVKPLLAERDLFLILSDDICEIGGRVYVKAVATLRDTNGVALSSVTAYAREEESKKGMDAAQVTGAASSYARKYALNGLFAIDDAKDADTDEYQKTQQRAKNTAQSAPTTQGGIIIPTKQENAADGRKLTEREADEYTGALAEMDAAEKRGDLVAIYNKYKNTAFAPALYKHAQGIITVRGWQYGNNK